MKILAALVFSFFALPPCAKAQDLADSVRALNAAQNRMAVGKEKAKDQVAALAKRAVALDPGQATYRVLAGMS